MGLRWHGSFELVYVKYGKVRVNKLDGEAELKENDVYIINSQEVHSYTDLDGKSKMLMLNVVPKAIAPYVKDPKVVPTFVQPRGDAKKFIANIMGEVYKCDEYKSKLISMKIRAAMYNIYYYMIRDCIDNSVSYVRGSQAEDFACARSAIRYMRSNYKNKITLGEIAKYVGMTPTHFSKYFKSKTDETFSKYLRKVRLEHAIYDLTVKKTTVKAAALENGFSNVNSFIGSCKVEYGRTPSELKNYGDS